MAVIVIGVGAYRISYIWTNGDPPSLADLASGTLLSTAASTAFRLDPPPDSVDEFVDILTTDPLIESVDVHDHGDAIVLCGHWNLLKLDFVRTRRWVRAADAWPAR